MYYLNALAVCCMLNLSACSDNNDGDDNGDEPSGLFEGTLEDATYQADAVKYKVSGNAEIGSIELTSSGNFLILPPETDYDPSVSSKANGSTQFGTFTKNGDGSYQLGEYATLSKIGENQVKLEKTNGSSNTLSVSKEESKAENNKLNNRLCRSWHPTSVTLTAYQNGKLISTQTLNSSHDLEEEFYDYIIITQFGTFLQVDYGNIVEAPGRWSWTDTEQQKFNYSHPDGNGTVQVSFTDDVAWFYEEYSDVDDEGQSITIKVNAKCKAC